MLIIRTSGAAAIATLIAAHADLRKKDAPHAPDAAKQEHAITDQSALGNLEFFDDQARLLDNPHTDV
ncbi:MAG: hypothetical protein AAGC77_01950 [Pseudomonadota bacterium]